MENKIVTTFDGTTAPRRRCRHIKGKYYEVNRQCFKVGEKYHRINNGKITLDYERQKYVLKGSKGLTYGIVGRQDDAPMFGYFSPNITKNVRLEPNGSPSERCLSQDVAEKLGYREVISTGHFVNPEEYTGSNRKEVEEFLNHKRTQPREFYSFPIHYGAAPLIRMFDGYFDNFEPIGYVPKGIEQHLRRFTFGIEYETGRGTIPERLLYKNGLIACRDGSIGGFEFVTIPMSGRKGLQAIQNHCELLRKYCIIDHMCSLHIHLGGYPISKESVVAMYRLLVAIQDEMYMMFPRHYRDTSYFKRMNYCGSLRAVGMSGGIAGAFSRIYEILTNGNGSFHGFNGEEHPMDMSGEHKWNISPRYKWASLIPLIFGRRGTVEFRIHTPTMNPDKVINWLFITSAVLSYAMDNMEELTKSRLSKDVNLINIIKTVYRGNPISKTLCDYINYRRKLFSDDKDSMGENEVREDSRTLPKAVRII